MSNVHSLSGREIEYENLACTFLMQIADIFILQTSGWSIFHCSWTATLEQLTSLPVWF